MNYADTLAALHGFLGQPVVAVVYGSADGCLSALAVFRGILRSGAVREEPILVSDPSHGEVRLFNVGSASGCGFVLAEAELKESQWLTEGLCPILDIRIGAADIVVYGDPAGPS